MKLSRTACYAIHAVVYMAAQGPNEIVIGHRAAKALGIPQGFLLRILVALSRARILWSIKGPNGGYRLARPARNISLLDVVEAVEGPLQGAYVTFQDDHSEVDLQLEKILHSTNELLRRHLQKVRIADLASRK